MKLVKNKKVVSLRPTNPGIRKILKDALSHAHGMRGVIVIEVRKNKHDKHHIISHSGMRAETLLWAAELAKEKIKKRIFENI